MPKRILKGRVVSCNNDKTVIVEVTRTVKHKLYKKIIEKRVKHIVISLDDDAFKDSLKMTNQFMDMGINVSFVKLKGKDPSEIGYEKMTSELFNSQRVDFKELMRMKLYGNK